ncbi:MAG TPA: adenylate/guanylate cyclase domain-containing protein [Spirochaetota bacterium]|nr:adenylate/guanylate cyclase domain-containing protein [Spirochaetota bacterium]
MRRVSIRISLSTAFVCTAVLLTLLLGIVTVYSIRDFVVEDIRSRLHDDAAIAALQIDPELHRHIAGAGDVNLPQYKRIRTVLANILRETKDIRYVYTLRKNMRGEVYFVVDADDDEAGRSTPGEVYPSPTQAMRMAFKKPYSIHVEKELAVDRWGTTLSSYAPVLRKDGTLEAVLGMDITAQKIVEYEYKYIRTVVLLGLIGSVIVVLLGLYLSKRISRPMKLLEEDMNQVRNFNLDSSTDIRTSISEVWNMKCAVDNMKNGLRSFRKYVPADLVAELIQLNREAALSGETRTLTVFFSDIANFTGISEKLTPEYLAEYLGYYFKGMTSTLLENRATVDKYIGDSIMAFWGAPHDDNDHALHACVSALRCQRFLYSMKDEWERQGIPFFETRIGIHSGDVMVGNIGYEERLSYTVMGDGVNLASRLEGLNKYYGTHIIISESTYALVRDVMAARCIDVVAVKGKTTGVPIFELVCERDAITQEEQSFLDVFNRGFDTYMRREWNSALDIFNEVLKMRPEDKPALMLKERCGRFMDDPPPADWTGVVVMREK